MKIQNYEDLKSRVELWYADEGYKQDNNPQTFRRKIELYLLHGIDVITKADKERKLQACDFYLRACVVTMKKFPNVKPFEDCFDKIKELNDSCLEEKGGKKMTEKEKMYKDMILKFHNDENHYIIFKEVEGKVVMVDGDWAEPGYSAIQKLPNVTVYDSYREAFEVWSQGMIDYYQDYCENEEDDFFYDFTKEEIKLLEEYIKEDK